MFRIHEACCLGVRDDVCRDVFLVGLSESQYTRITKLLPPIGVSNAPFSFGPEKGEVHGATSYSFQWEIMVLPLVLYSAALTGLPLAHNTLQPTKSTSRFPPCSCALARTLAKLLRVSTARRHAATQVTPRVKSNRSIQFFFPHHLLLTQRRRQDLTSWKGSDYSVFVCVCLCFYVCTCTPSIKSYGTYTFHCKCKFLLCWRTKFLI